MFNSTSITYQMKREILSFSNKISNHLSKPDRKFSTDMAYGILASKSCLLTDTSISFMNLPKRAILWSVLPDIRIKVFLKLP